MKSTRPALVVVADDAEADRRPLLRVRRGMREPAHTRVLDAFAEAINRLRPGGADGGDVFVRKPEVVALGPRRISVGIGKNRVMIDDIRIGPAAVVQPRGRNLQLPLRGDYVEQSTRRERIRGDVAKELTLEQVLGDRAAVDLDERAAFARAVLVDGAGDEFLARAALAVDEHCGIGGRDELDLLQHLLQSRTVPDDVVRAKGCCDFLAQIKILQFEPFLERRDLLERPGVGDAHRRMISEDTQPLEIFIAQHSSIEEGQHAQYFAPKRERLRGERLHLFALDPFEAVGGL